MVLPVYNRAAELAGAVASVLAQTEPDWELIVVDDASSDEVASAVEAFGDSRIRLAVRKANGGVAAAQNTGVASSDSEFVAFLHSDDRYLPHKLAVQGAALAAEPSHVLAVESAHLASGSTTPVPPGLRGLGYEDLLSFRTGVHVVPMLFRRAAVAELGFDDDLRAWEDWDLLARILRRGEVLATDDVVAQLRKEGDDRLTDSPWMARGLEHLLAKYADELAAQPHLRAAWHLKLGRAHLRNGATASARRHFLQSVRDDHRRVQLLVPAAATLLGRRAGMLGWRGYETVGRRKDSGLARAVRSGRRLRSATPRR